MPNPTVTTDADARFVAKFKIDDSGCWLWTAGTDRYGYGAFKFQGRLVRAHRWSFERWVGIIPDGLQIDHLCRVRNCVNPEHLEPVTLRENLRRGIWRSAVNCRNGHPLVAGNLVSRGDRRTCLVCHRATNREVKRRSRHRNKELAALMTSG